MDEALNYIFYIFNKIVDFLFNQEFISGVSVGWVFIVLCAFAIISNSLLNVPSGLIFKNLRKGKDDEQI